MHSQATTPATALATISCGQVDSHARPAPAARRFGTEAARQPLADGAGASCWRAAARRALGQSRGGGCPCLRMSAAHGTAAARVLQRAHDARSAVRGRAAPAPRVRRRPPPRRWQVSGPATGHSALGGPRQVRQGGVGRGALHCGHQESQRRTRRRGNSGAVAAGPDGQARAGARGRGRLSTGRPRRNPPRRSRRRRCCRRQAATARRRPR